MISWMDITVIENSKSFNNWRSDNFTIRMIIHYNHNKPVQVYVVNSRLPVYKTYYGDGLGNTILGFFYKNGAKSCSSC